MLYESCITKASFDLWLKESSAGSDERLHRLKQMLPVAIAECCSEKQRIYITHYFADGMNTPEIAALYGVNKSTVSRGIKRGLRRMYDHLKYCSPELCTVQQKQERLTQKSGQKKRARYHQVKAVEDTT